MFKSTRRKALTDTNFVAPDTPICTSPWTGIAPFTTHLSAAAHNVSTSVTNAQPLLTLMPQSVPRPSSSEIPAPLPKELALLLQAEQSIQHVPVPGSSSDARQVASEYGANLTEFVAHLGHTS